MSQKSQKGEYMDNNIDETTSLWVSTLLHEFNTQNNIIRKHLHDYLERPNFVISLQLNHLMGSWDSNTRTISINRELLYRNSWTDVLETLKHEMAHMIVDEIFKIDGPSHGEAFVRASQVLGIEYKDGKEYHISNNEEWARLVGKVHKLFALGDSNHKAEAEAAVAKAYEIMAKYNISINESGNDKIYTSRPIGKRWKKVPVYVSNLAHIMQKYYFINHIRCGNRDTGQHYEFFGQVHNLDIAEYVFNFLIDEGIRQWDYFRSSPEYMESRHKPSKIAFLDGLYHGFEIKLDQVNKLVYDKQNGINLPILAKDKMLEEAFGKRYPSTRSIHNFGYSNHNGFEHGVKHGKNITINPCIKRSNMSRLIA